MIQPLTLVSFSYKHGAPPENAELVIDCRAMRNPWTVPKFRELTGLNIMVQTFVGQDPKFTELLGLAMERCRFGGTIAFGCLGGKHRSVAMAELCHARLKDMGYESKVMHMVLQ